MDNILGYTSLVELGNKIDEIISEFKIKGADLVIKTDENKIKKIDEDIFYRCSNIDKSDKDKEKYVSEAKEVILNFKNFNLLIQSDNG